MTEKISATDPIAYEEKRDGQLCWIDVKEAYRFIVFQMRHITFGLMLFMLIGQFVQGFGMGIGWLSRPPSLQDGKLAADAALAAQPAQRALREAEARQMAEQIVGEGGGDVEKIKQFLMTGKVEK